MCRLVVREFYRRMLILTLKSRPRQQNARLGENVNVKEALLKRLVCVSVWGRRLGCAGDEPSEVSNFTEWIRRLAADLNARGPFSQDQ